MSGRIEGPPGAADLKRLLAYLSIKPSIETQALDHLLERAPVVELTPDLMASIDEKRASVTETRDARQLGLFDFYLGLVFLTYKRYGEAGLCFESAGNQWSLYQERPHVCLARFAIGAAQHDDLNLSQAATTYAEVAKEASRIRRELEGGFYSRQVEYQQTFADYRGFSDDLAALIEKARNSLPTDDLTQPGRRSIPQPQVSLDSGDHQLSGLRPYRLDRMGLLQLMESSFSDEEIDEICSALTVNCSPPTGAEDSGKSRGLVDQLEQRDRIPELLDELRRRRPYHDWDGTFEYVSQEADTERFIAPMPTPYPAGRRKEWFRVVRKVEPFIEDIEVGDWLYAPSVHVAEGDVEGHVIVAGLVDGSIEVQPEDEPSGPSLYLAKFIRNTVTGEVRVMTRSGNRPVTLVPQQIRGNVIRRCKKC